MRKISVILLSLVLLGCADISKIKQLEMRTIELEELIAHKDTEIQKLKEAAGENEKLIKEKDAKIEELRKKLESLGVF